MSLLDYDPVWNAEKYLASAPPPQGEPVYILHFVNDMGRLGMIVEPEYSGDIELLGPAIPYVERDIRTVFIKCLGGSRLIKLRNGVPMQRNVSIKKLGSSEWITVCLDYSGLNHCVSDSDD
jgi:hypothetical protein